MNLNDRVLERQRRTPEPELQPSHLGDALRQSLLRGLELNEAGRVGRCIACSRWITDHFDARNRFVSCDALNLLPQSPCQ